MTHILRRNRPKVNEEPVPPQDPLRYRVHIACYETRGTPRTYRLLALEDGTMITRLSRELTRELMEMALILTNHGTQERDKFETEDGETFVFVYERRRRTAPVEPPTYRDDFGWRLGIEIDIRQTNLRPLNLTGDGSKRSRKHPYA